MAEVVFQDELSEAPGAIAGGLDEGVMASAAVSMTMTQPQIVLIKTVLPFDQQVKFETFCKNSSTTFRFGSIFLFQFMDRVPPRNNDGLLYVGFRYNAQAAPRLAALITDHETRFLAGTEPY